MMQRRWWWPSFVVVLLCAVAFAQYRPKCGDPGGQGPPGPTGATGPAGDSGAGLTATVDLVAADVNALSGTPVAIVAAVPGKIIRVLHAFLQVDAGTHRFGKYPWDPIVLYYDGDGDHTPIAQWETVPEFSTLMATDQRSETATLAANPNGLPNTLTVGKAVYVTVAHNPGDYGAVDTLSVNAAGTGFAPTEVVVVHQGLADSQDIVVDTVDGSGGVVTFHLYLNLPQAPYAVGAATTVGGRRITGSALNGGGTGYVASDTFTPAGGGGSFAQGVIDTVDQNGAVVTYHFTTQGQDYNPGTNIPTGTSGAGTGFTIDITQVRDGLTFTVDAITVGNGTARIVAEYALEDPL